MTRPDEEHAENLARRSRLIASVIIGTVALWVLAQYVGAQLDVPTRWLGLLDLIALVALGWALVAVIQLWRARRSEGGPDAR